MRAPHQKTSAHDLLRRLCRGVVTHPNAKLCHLPIMDTDCQPLKHPIQFILKCPDEGVICPITQEPITAIDTNECQALPLDLDHPDRTAIKLICQHEFSAFWLIYNWAHNDNVRCPLCCAGPPNARLDIPLMPPHIRVSVQRHMRRIMPVAASGESDAVRAALAFIETVAGKSFLDQFPEQSTKEFYNRLECKSGVSRSTGEDLVVLSTAKGLEVFIHYINWYQCDPVKHASNSIFLDMDEPIDNFNILLPLQMVIGMMCHIMTVMFGMALTSRYDNRKRTHLYSVFQQHVQ